VNPFRRSPSRIVGTIAVGLVLAIYMYACAARPAPTLPPPLVLPTIGQPIPPIATPTPASHIVKVSWYGPGLAGRKTTSGEVYNPRALTAASKTLPIGSVVKVTNPQNGKSVNVRINDRGPFIRGRSLDLSQRAAEKIGVIHIGVARVKVSSAAPPEGK
jgi:rare lipoprotein A